MIKYSISLALWLAMCAAGVAAVEATEIPPLSACKQVVAPQYGCLQTGRHVVFVCTNAAETYTYAAGLSCLHSACSPSAFAASLLKVTTSPDWKKAADAEWAANVKWTCDAPPDEQTKALCLERKTWIATNWPEWTKDFKPAVWKVKANGTALDRPAYAMVNGVLSTKSTAKVAVGETCDAAKAVKPSGSALWAPAGSAGLIALCVKQ